MGLDLALVRRHGSGSTAVEEEVLYLRKGWSMFRYFEDNFGMDDDGSTRFIEIEDVYKLIRDFEAIVEDYEVNDSFAKGEELYPIMSGDIHIENYDKEYIEHVKDVLKSVKGNIKNFDGRFEDLLIYGSY